MSFSYGREFVINGTICYPGYLSKDNLQILAEVLRDHIIIDDNYQLEVRGYLDYKGLEWQIKTFSLKGRTMYHTRTYCVTINQYWSINLFIDNWLSGGTKERCEELPIGEKLKVAYQKSIELIHTDIKSTYEKTKIDFLTYRFLLGGNFKVILANDERGIRNFVSNSYLHKSLN